MTRDEQEKATSFEQWWNENEGYLLSLSRMSVAKIAWETARELLAGMGKPDIFRSIVPKMR